MSTLETLADAIASAAARDEPSLFAQALAFVGPDAKLRRCCAARAFADAAILFHCALLPANAYQLGETSSRRGLASTWRKGDAHALPFDAATPGLALLGATMHAIARNCETESRANCKRCHGRGWIVTRDGGKRLCAHAIRS